LIFVKSHNRKLPINHRGMRYVLEFIHQTHMDEKASSVPWTEIHIKLAHEWLSVVKTSDQHFSKQIALPCNCPYKKVAIFLKILQITKDKGFGQTCNQEWKWGVGT